MEKVEKVNGEWSISEFSWLFSCEILCNLFNRSGFSPLR